MGTIKSATYRVIHQSPGHTTFGVWVNGAKSGDLVVRNEEVSAFRLMLATGGFAPTHPIRETISFTFENEAQQKRFHEKLKDIRWKCGALAQGTAGGNDPAECDWPTCGCDDYASRVISTLHESGWRSPDEVHEYAKRTREQVIREYEADKKE